MDKLKLDIQRRSVPCYISTSAINECTHKLDFTENFFGNVFRTFAEGYFNNCRQQQGKSPNDPISKGDFRIFAGLFNEFRKNIGFVLQRPLRELEKKMILNVEQILRTKAKINFNSFLNGFIAQALFLSAHLRIQKVKFFVNEQGFFKKNSIMPDTNTTNRLLANVNSSQRFPFHREDADNISSAWAYMNKSGEKTVFASFDFRTVISHAEEIFKIISLQCTDPLYAVHYL
jgi:hypothetical protein